MPGNEPDREPLHEGGVFGFKCFTVDSGVPEFPPLGYDQVERAARQVASLGSLLLVHAEDAAVIERVRSSGQTDYAAFLRSRPDAAETTAIERLVDISRRTGARIDILHLSSAAAVPLLAEARQAGRSQQRAPALSGAGRAGRRQAGATQFKCCPPIRDRANTEQLWDALRAGVIDCVVSDHSPCPPDLKRLDRGDFEAASGWDLVAATGAAGGVVPGARSRLLGRRCR